MKKLFTLLTMALFVTGAMAQTSFSDDFESYSEGDYVGVESDQWTTWSGTTGGAEDATVVTDQSASGSNSIYFDGVAAGGPQDVLLLFGDEYADGLFTFSTKMLIESGANGYFNFQAQTTPGQV
jgi:hypothetical protein